ncbi:DUF58 domain-containing protein [Peribacillus sp. NPDC097295]|uniref:DUF58 domain-containing protein n=1 Tax=Peribacillus sp. NPDC097295 TaxID=3364402 RepID=UPI0037F7AA91
MGRMLTLLKKNRSVSGILILMLLSFSFAMFQGGFISWFIFYTFLPFAVYAMILVFYPLQAFDVERKISKQECQAGESVEITLIFSRKNRLPLLYMVVEEELPIDMTKRTLLFPGFKRSFNLTYTLDSLPRGEHFLHAVRFSIGDFLGLYEKEATMRSPMKITVFPTYQELNYKHLEYVFTQGQVGSSKKRQREHSVVSGIREYQPGDQLSWINWKATARTSEIMTKEFEEQRSHDTLLLLDEQVSPFFEEAIVLTASLVHALIKRGMDVGLASTGSREVVPARGGSKQRRKLFYQLTKAKATSINVWNGKLQKGIVPSNASVICVITELTMEKLDGLSAFGGNQMTLFCVKSPGDFTSEEKNVKSVALARGMKLGFFEPGHLQNERTEVKANAR